MGEKVITEQTILLFDKLVMVADFITDVLNPQYSFSLN